MSLLFYLFDVKCVYTGVTVEIYIYFERCFVVARIQVSIDDDVLALVDNFANSISLTRSAFLSMAAKSYIDAQRKAPLVTSAFSSMAALIDAKVKGEISQEVFQSSIDSLNQAVKEISK